MLYTLNVNLSTVMMKYNIKLAAVVSAEARPGLYINLPPGETHSNLNNIF